MHLRRPHRFEITLYDKQPWYPFWYPNFFLIPAATSLLFTSAKLTPFALPTFMAPLSPSAALPRDPTLEGYRFSEFEFLGLYIEWCGEVRVGCIPGVNPGDLGPDRSEATRSTWF